MLRRTIVTALFCAWRRPVQAQWLNHPAAGIPRTKDGKPNLSAPTPRGANGKPDLSGVWSTDPTPFAEMERLFGDLKAFAVPGDDPRTFTKYFLNIFADFSPRTPRSGPRPPRRSDATCRRRQPIRRRRPGAFRPASPWAICCRCRAGSMQTPGLFAILYEGINPHRMIYTDGRTLPVDPQPAWLGYSVGSWDGDVFVVQSSGYSDRSWLDGIGHARSEATRITERIRRRDFGHLEVDVTIDDPPIVHQAVLDSLHADTRSGHRHPRGHLHREREGSSAPGRTEVTGAAKGSPVSGRRCAR